MRVLLAEPDPTEAEAERLRQTLLEAGYAVEAAPDEEETMRLVRLRLYDGLILALGVSAEAGLGLLRGLRAQGPAPAIILLARPGEGDSGAAGLEAGGDDYLVKPISEVEFLARLKARLGARRRERTGALRIGDLEMHLNDRTVFRAGEPVALTPRQAAVLEALMLAAPAPLSKEALVERVWGRHLGPKTNAVNVIINQLRDRTARARRSWCIPSAASVTSCA